MQGFAFLVRFFLASPFVGDVPRDLGKANQRAMFIVNRVYDHAGPEQGTVLAHPPCLFLESVFAGGNFQATLRFTSELVFFCIESGKMLANNFRSEEHTSEPS